MENNMNSDTILIPTVHENTDNDNYYVIVPKSENNEEENKQDPSNHYSQLLMPKSHILQYIDGTPGQPQLAHHSQQRMPIRSNRDDRKRANHNEIERRRRVKISSWISKLGMMLPVPSNNKHESKSDTLVKVCDYIKELKAHKKKLTQKCTEFKSIKESLQSLEAKVNAGLEENGYLKDELLKCGFQLEQVTAPEVNTNQQESSYLVFNESNNQHKDDNNTNNTMNNNDDDDNNEDDNHGGDDNDADDDAHTTAAMHDDIDTYFRT